MLTQQPRHAPSYIHILWMLFWILCHRLPSATVIMQGAVASVPRNLLSKEVEGKSLEEITAALSKERGFRLFLTDVGPRADLTQLFSRWKGDFKAEEVRGQPDKMVVTFSTEEQLKEALLAFGGGLRGAFLVDRKSTTGLLQAI